MNAAECCLPLLLPFGDHPSLPAQTAAMEVVQAQRGCEGERYPLASVGKVPERSHHLMQQSHPPHCCFEVHLVNCHT